MALAPMPVTAPSAACVALRGARPWSPVASAAARTPLPVSPSPSVRLQWTEGPSSSALHCAQLGPILHLRSPVIERYQL